MTQRGPEGAQRPCRINYPCGAAFLQGPRPTADPKPQPFSFTRAPGVPDVETGKDLEAKARAWGWSAGSGQEAHRRAPWERTPRAGFLSPTAGGAKETS